MSHIKPTHCAGFLFIKNIIYKKINFRIYTEVKPLNVDGIQLENEMNKSVLYENASVQ